MEEPTNWCPPYQAGRQVLIKTQCLVSLLHTACALEFVICFRRHTVIQVSQRAHSISVACAGEKDGVGLE